MTGPADDADPTAASPGGRGPADQPLEPALDAERVARRVDDRTPKEVAAGADDPRAQVLAILADSEERMIEQAEDPEHSGERRTSNEATEPL